MEDLGLNDDMGFIKKNNLYGHIEDAIGEPSSGRHVKATKNDSEILRHHYDKDTKNEHTMAITKLGNKVHKIHGSKFE